VTTTKEYVEDVPYVRQFISELSPIQLRLVAALNGLTPPPARDFDYCELGCGHGDSVAALAAAFPESRFLGIDLNADHIASAKRLVRDGALENAGFLEGDFTKLIEGDDVGGGEGFDFITAHGVLTWVSPTVRKGLLDFARAKLKPGGLLYVTYNAMPGWASVEPLRQLLLSPLGGPGGAENESTLERANRGLNFAHAMEKLGAQYFALNPSASGMLATMTKAGLSYVVHEYMHEHWTPMYFARVAWEMASSDLHFAGVLPPFLNFRDLAIPASLEGVFTDVSDRVTFESLKDFAINEFFRRDVYVKGKHPRSPETTNAYMDETPWGLVANANLIPADRKVTLPHREITFEGPLFDALFDVLKEGASTMEAMMNHAALANEPKEQVRAALLKIVLAEVVRPMLRPTTTRPANPDAMYSLPSVYNQMMVKRSGLADTPLVLISTAAGTAFPISALDALAIRILTEVAPPDRTKWIEDFVGRSVLRLKVGDHIVSNRPDQIKLIEEARTTLSTKALSKLVELGILIAG
jgi:SAM-dependent methyltransferase